ncbi:hypothetical protein NPIL_346091 [Nephila pilipes]|uniref:Uncharacterized protein n=1 Tax=Nephila pilipes TaxID=299642 RepID=A0A8X6Q3L6_NEPPI|nr:hypothetical protein NPIL_346091 [Nephila pilipes]
MKRRREGEIHEDRADIRRKKGKSGGLCLQAGMRCSPCADPRPVVLELARVTAPDRPGSRQGVPRAAVQNI